MVFQAYVTAVRYFKKCMENLGRMLNVMQRKWRRKCVHPSAVDKITPLGNSSSNEPHQHLLLQLLITLEWPMMSHTILLHCNQQLTCRSNQQLTHSSAQNDTTTKVIAAEQLSAQ